MHLAILRREDVPGVPGDGALTAPTAPAPAVAPAVPTARPARTNLPAQLTSFVGREEESRRVGKLLRETRLVTLTGPGGAGKTRLAGESAGALVEEMPDGVWFVPLASVGDPGEVTTAVLVALNVPEVVRHTETRSAVRPLDRLIDFLAGKRMVLVLDNCEHVIDAVAGLVDDVLGQAPGVRVLATSREPLGITGESLCPVPSLPLPPEGEPAEPPEALRYAAVRLFADRAAAVRPGFAVDAGTVDDVVGICRALDGIPLAIELAAARLRSLTPGQVAARLGDRFRLLTAGSRTALPRHRTLRAVIDWSWDLLDGAERTVLRRLSVFGGGAAPEAAVQVCGLPAPGAPDPSDVMDVIAALVEKSLVMADGDAEVRYRLLETVRVYAEERLEEAGETHRVRAEHAAYCVRLAERAEPELRRGDQLRWADRLGAERGNFAAVFRFVADSRDLATGLRLVASLTWYWVMKDLEMEAGGHAVAVRDIADSGGTVPPELAEQYSICVITADLVTEMSSEQGPTTESMRTLLDRVVATVPPSPRHPIAVLIRPAVRLFRNDIEGARREVMAVIDHEDPWVRAMCRTVLGFIGFGSGKIDEAAMELTVGHAGFSELGDRFGLIISLGGLAEVSLARGEPAEAVRLGEEAYGYATQGVSPEQGSVMLLHLARARAQMGDLTRARQDLERALAHAERIGEFSDAAAAALQLCELSLQEGDREGARPHIDRACEWVEPRRHRPDFTQVYRKTYSRLGCLAEEEGDLEAAADWHTRALDGAGTDTINSFLTLATLVDGVAALNAARGEHGRAAELLGAAHGLRGFRDRGSYEVGRTVRSATHALGEEGFAAAYDRGRALDRDVVLAKATELVRSS
ncbi:ATP-binding protein [Actinomadura roseirufa]|uniref:ATP-binding protein n=1 Tax=Actinomadura roseirufa TaxID=2094049 RepID=UPI003F96701C